MRCAVVNINTNTIENIAVADANVDSPPDGYILIALPEWASPEIGDIWSNSMLRRPSPIENLDDPILTLPKVEEASDDN